jgi:hypothetical protein
VTKLSWETLIDLVPSQALTASRLYKRIMRHYCYMQLYDSGKKAQNQHLFDFKNLTDEDLMIDFKLSLKDTKDKQLFNMLLNGVYMKKPKKRMKKTHKYTA